MTIRPRTISRRQSSSSMDAISLLKKDHQKVRQLLTRLENTTARAPKQRQELLSEIETEVKIHTMIEEEIFYPAYKDAVRSKTDEKLYYESLEEHHVVDMVMPEIKSTDEESEEFAAKAKVLKDLIEHHAEEEESQMFPRARKAMGMERLRELGDEMQDRKQELQGGLMVRGAKTIGRFMGRASRKSRRAA
jgi:hemerythrin-like domain-containing protein